MDFIQKLINTLSEEYNVSETENGAVGYRTTGKALLDLNFSVSSLRNRRDNEVIESYAKAFFENKFLAVKWLFFAGDVRGGLGERRLTRLGLRFLAQAEPELVKKLLPLIPEYTRWDNLLGLLDTELKDSVCELIVKQLNKDKEDMAAQKSVSLCAKWMPSVNASSKTTLRHAKILVKYMGVTEKEYRVLLSKLRSYVDVVEKKMSAKKWDEIDYAAVPSKANLIYNGAFIRNDEERRRKYLEMLEKGETKINASLFPHEIVHKYVNDLGRIVLAKKKDVSLEEMWKALPDYVNGNSNTICVSDGSGSMTMRIGNTKVACIEVAVALSIYFAERSSGQFKDKFITFSENPQLVDFSRCKSLRDKIGVALSHDEVANTNIEAVFDLILKTAIKAKMKQSDLPENILILSDMEFDACAVTTNYSDPNSGFFRVGAIQPKLFQVISEKYEQQGYKLPRLIFWNICSRTGTIPVKENDLGVALVSGFSPTIAKMVLSNRLDPFECLLEQLNASRYEAVENAIKGLL